MARDALALDEPLPGRQWTLRQLLQHRAGVPNYGGMAAYREAVARSDSPWPVADLLERAGSALDFAPGAGWAYSNIGYLFVRELIEETTSTEIGEAMQRLVFGPLHLGSVRLARSPEDLDQTVWGNPNRYHPGWVYHGLLMGTAVDAARLVDGLFTGGLLPAPLVETMRTPHPLGGALAIGLGRARAMGLG